MLGVVGCLAIAALAVAASPGGWRGQDLQLSASGASGISNSREGGAILEVENLAPGGRDVGSVTVGNTTGEAGTLTLGASPPLDEVGPNGGVLSTRLHLTVSDTSSGEPAAVYTGPLAEMPATTELGALAAGEERSFLFAVDFPDGGSPPGDSVGDNAFQGAGVSVDYSWTLGGADSGLCTAVQRGGDRSDRLVGTSGGDRLIGGGGADRLVAKAGADCLGGGPGADRLRGGPGPDHLRGGPGDDVLKPGPGDDVVSARGGGIDTIHCSGSGAGDEIYPGVSDILVGC
jgi:Ca2+-binding RTX toxin-like protein